MMKKLRKANRAVYGGAMTLNTMQLMKPGTNATTSMGALQGSIGIGMVGLVSDKMMSIGEKKRRRGAHLTPGV